VLHTYTWQYMFCAKCTVPVPLVGLGSEGSGTRLGVWAPDREVGPAGYLASVVTAVGGVIPARCPGSCQGPHSLQGTQSLAVFSPPLSPCL